MSLLFKALLQAFTVDDTPPKHHRRQTSKPPKPKPEPVEPWTVTDSRKTWYQLEQEERKELENRARAVLIAQGHTKPEIVESCSNIELIHLIYNKYSRVR